MLSNMPGNIGELCISSSTISFSTIGHISGGTGHSSVQTEL